MKSRREARARFRHAITVLHGHGRNCWCKSCLHSFFYKPSSRPSDQRWAIKMANRYHDNQETAEGRSAPYVAYGWPNSVYGVYTWWKGKYVYVKR